MFQIFKNLLLTMVTKRDKMTTLFETATKTEGGDNMDRSKIAQRLRDLRLGFSLSAEEVCTEVGISTSALAMYENGYRVPRDEIKIKLAHLYGTTVDALFFS